MPVGTGLRGQGLRVSTLAQAVRRLFAAGEQGAWYDPSDFGATGTNSIGTLYQDAQGTTPVTAVEQPVGLMLDKRNGIPTITELLTNNDFATDTVWTKGTGWTIAAGVATKAAGSASLLSQSVTVTAGVTYRLVYTITRTAGTITPQLTGGSTVNGTARSASGTYVETLTAVSGNITFALSADASFAGTVDNVYLKRVAGNDAYQSTSAARPTLRARYNLLTYSEQFDNAVWTKNDTSITQNATTAPDGTLTADKLVENALNALHRAQQYPLSPNLVVGLSYTATCYLKAAERTWVSIHLPGTGSSFGWFNLGSGVIGTLQANVTAGSMTAVGDGWYRCSITVTNGAALSGVGINTATGDNVQGYAGDGTSGIYVWGADMRPTNQITTGLPAYQRIAAATDYDTVGFPVYIQGNGTSQFMQTAAIDLSGTAKATVFAAVRKLSDAAVSSVLEHGVGGVDALAASMLFAPRSATTANYGGDLRAGGLASSYFSTANKAAPVSNVATTLMDYTGGTIAAQIAGRYNGAADVGINSGSGPVTSAGFGNYPLYLLARAGTSAFFSGNFYGAIIRGAATNADVIQTVERYLQKQSKAY